MVITWRYRRPPWLSVLHAGKPTVARPTSTSTRDHGGSCRTAFMILAPQPGLLWPGRGFSGNRVMIGAIGYAYVYTHTLSQGWTQTAAIANPGPSGDSFGQSVALSGTGTTAVIAAPGVSPVGAAYVYHLSGTTWSQQQELTDQAAANRLGRGDVGERLLVGMPIGGQPDCGTAFASTIRHSVHHAAADRRSRSVMHLKRQVWLLGRTDEYVWGIRGPRRHQRPRSQLRTAGSLTRATCPASWLRSASRFCESRVTA